MSTEEDLYASPESALEKQRPAGQPTEDDYRNFIGPNADYYLKVWQDPEPEPGPQGVGCLVSESRDEAPVQAARACLLSFSTWSGSATDGSTGRRSTSPSCCSRPTWQPTWSSSGWATPKGIRGSGGWSSACSWLPTSRRWRTAGINEASTAGKWELSGRSWVGAVICPIVSLFGFVVIGIGFYVMLEAFGIPTPMPAE